MRSALLAQLVACGLVLSACRPPNVNEATTVKPLGADRHLITIVQDDGLEDSTITEYIRLKAAETCVDTYEIEKQEDDHAVVKCVDFPDIARPTKTKPRQWEENGITVSAIDEPAWCSLVGDDGPCYLTRETCDEYVTRSTDAGACTKAPSAVCFTGTYITSGKVTTFCARQMAGCETMRGLVDPQRYRRIRDCGIARYEGE